MKPKEKQFIRELGYILAVELVEQYPNDFELGKKIRQFVKLYQKNNKL